MKRILLVVVIAAALGLSGCQPKESPPDKKTHAGEKADADVEQPSSRPAVEPAAPGASKCTKEQTAAAKQLAAELGVAIKEDAQGNVVSLDTAASRSWADNNQMEKMLAFPKLNSLTIEGPSIDDTLVPKIVEHSGLTSLALRNTLIGDDGIRQFAGLKQLSVIDLRLCPMVTDKAIETLAAMPELKAVRLSGTNVTDAGIAALLALPRLQELDVRNCRGVGPATFERLPAKKSLRVLKIGGEKIDDAVLAIVGRMDQLTGLSLDNCAISDLGVAKLANLPLDNFTIYQCAKVTDAGVEVVARMDNLTQLTLRDVGVRGTVLRKLPKPERLVALNLSQSKISDAEIELLATLSHLETLVLIGTSITDASVEGLSKLTSLKSLDVTQSGLTSAGVAKLQAALPKCQIQFN